MSLAELWLRQRPGCRQAHNQCSKKYFKSKQKSTQCQVKGSALPKKLYKKRHVLLNV